MELTGLTSGIKLSSAVLLAAIYLTCCCTTAWPVVPSNRRVESSFYYPSLMTDRIPDDEEGRWEEFPEQWGYELPEDDDYYIGANGPNEIDDFGRIMELYEEASLPLWGQMVDEEPESELEQLKAAQQAKTSRRNEIHQQIMEKRQNKGPIRQQQTKNLDTSTVTPKKQMVVETPKTNTIATSNAQQEQTSGQKEIPMLRPPSVLKGKTSDAQSKEPVVSVQQRSRPMEKPSAYDTLRKYLSLEDALRNEAEKRRTNSRNHQKRSSIVTDTETLTGQLNHLKKKTN